MPALGLAALCGDCDGFVGRAEWLERLAQLQTELNDESEASSRLTNLVAKPSREVTSARKEMHEAYRELLHTRGEALIVQKVLRPRQPSRFQLYKMFVWQIIQREAAKLALRQVEVLSMPELE